MNRKVYIYGDNFCGNSRGFKEKNQNASSPPILILDTNIAWRYKEFSSEVNELPGDKITIFAEIERYGNRGELKESEFELSKDPEIRRMKEVLLETFNSMFNENEIKKYHSYLNSTPNLKGLRKIEKVRALIKHHEEHEGVNFYILLCLILSNINCDLKKAFSGILHSPQEEFSIKQTRNILCDLFIIENVNGFIDEGMNVFFCSNDKAAISYCDIMNSLTTTISIYGLNINHHRLGLWGIENDIFKPINKDKELQMIVNSIREKIYVNWKNASQNRVHEFKMKPIENTFYMIGAYQNIDSSSLIYSGLFYHGAQMFR
ncbi:hypothetical protein HZI31_20355 [Serratia fonticola]|uniref:hypothetical protein n=1 Tax=Serratia fonticola TaxID=47917 RepID=UPI0015C62441|nr:hypothetical protein [Serratia fonticola]NYA45649.1 hypothetical protein [Serratia fonticola]